MSLGINHPWWDKGDPGKGYGAGLLQVWGYGPGLLQLVGMGYLWLFSGDGAG